jgi:hypothetical protein
MNVLDADDSPLVSSHGQKMVRDIVQFVPFNKFKNAHYSVLAAEVLEEIPRQVVEWVELNRLKPPNQASQISQTLSQNLNHLLRANQVADDFILVT